MKTYKLIALCMVSVLFGACDKSLDRDASLDISVASKENVSYDGKIITVKKGTPVEFLLAGDPDFLTFFSGEQGKKYEYRERETLDPSTVKKAILNFALWYQFGSVDQVEPKVYISNEFPGLQRDQFEQDSILVEQFENESKWIELIGTTEYPFPAGIGVDKRKSYSLDITQYMGKPVTIAIRYTGVKNNGTQPRMNFEDMHLTTITKNDLEYTYNASSFGLIPINMKYKSNFSDQKSMDKDREYGTVTGTVSGIWNMVNIGNNGFFIHSSSANTPMKYSWLVSKPIEVNSCYPDKGTQIKNISQRLNKYTYTYNQVGIYNATFLANNANMDYASTMVRHLVVNVVE